MSVPALPCTAINVGPMGLCITMPGGASICASYPTAGLASSIAIMKSLLGQASTALAPLMPFFRIIECLDAVKSILYDPDKFFTALAEVLGMLPALNVAYVVISALDVLLAYLTGLYACLQSYVLQVAAIAAAATKATTLGCPALTLQADCANAQLVLQMANVNNGMAPLNALIATMNILLGMVLGMPTIPTLATLGSDPAAALAPLQVMIDAIHVVRDAIPLPP